MFYQTCLYFGRSFFIQMILKLFKSWRKANFLQRLRVSEVGELRFVKITAKLNKAQASQFGGGAGLTPPS